MVSVDNYLAHFGVKGMQWGVRKERTQIKRDFRQRVNSEFQKELVKRTSKINALEQEARQIAKTHTFDLDDGGGGRTTKDRVAGKRYMQKWNAIDKLTQDAETAAVRNATKQLLDIHGSTKLKELKIKVDG